MAGKIKRKNGWQYVFKRSGVLSKPIYMTFADEVEGDAYAARLDLLLDRGIVPAEFNEQETPMFLRQLIGLYERDAHPSPKDRSALNTIVAEHGCVPLTVLCSEWVDTWITSMKRVDVLAPGTIRGKVGALARCCDWGMRKKFLTLPDHPFRTLPDGYSQYTQADAIAAGVCREDTERDRRLEVGEEEKILEAIKGGILKRKQRPLEIEHPEAYRLMFMMAINTAMRLREMYTLEIDGQVNLKKKTFFLEKTKNGSKRQVPMAKNVIAELEIYLKKHPKGFKGRLLPWWNGELCPKELHKTTDFLSRRYVHIFLEAGCEDLKFHDLRHEATSRLFERTNLSDASIMKITGHKSYRMLMRYANLRASTLADSLW